MRKEKNKYFLAEAITFIESIQDSIHDENASFIVCDNNAKILYSSNDSFSELTKEGLSLHEYNIGKNAVSLSLEYNEPTLLEADEHAENGLKEYISCSAPFHSDRKDTLGCVAYITHKSNETKLLKPMIISTAKAIEDNIKHKGLRQQLSSNTYYTFAIMNSLKFGVIAVDLSGEVQYANNFACHILKIKSKELKEINIETLIKDWKELVIQFQKENLLLNEETTFQLNRFKEKFNLSIFPIFDKNNKLIGMVNSIREMHKVYGLINKYTGANARYTFDDIVAQSKSMKNLISFTKKVSNSPSTVLLEGESGTGKEVLAQAIHNYSSRRDNGFIAINCAAIPESLIESELFGYDEGAFTGAKKGGQPGKFELANTGTIFLDEIGDMKLDMQVKLLRAIQEGAITRVGGDKLIPVDIRIIAASNKDLKHEVDTGNFRLDLYYRLNVIPIKLPPLRDRKEDIPTLIKHFLSKKARMLKKTKPNIKYRALQELLDYDWPGNIRELENHIEKIVNFNGDYELIKTPITEYTGERIEKVQIGGELITFTLEEMEKKTIIRTLKMMNGNISQTAKTLGIGRNTLYIKLKKYDIVL
jgi:transcriptional regulator with PAS, ATPase and Fis domain